jgi:hypothetical protein
MANTRTVTSACGLAALSGAAALSEYVGESHVSLLSPIYILWNQSRYCVSQKAFCHRNVNYSEIFMSDQ